MELHLIGSFLAASFILVITPGPDLLLLGSVTTTRGFNSGIRCSIGIFLSGLILTLAVALGLGNLFEAMPGVAYFVRIMGAIYFLGLALIYLRSCLRQKSNQLTITQEQDAKVVSVAPEVVGLLNNLLNPKALLFFSLFLPQFVSPDGWNATAQLLTLGIVLSTIALSVNVSVCFITARTRSKVDSISNHRSFFRSIFPAMFEGLAGALFLFLAYRLARTPASG